MTKIKVSLFLLFSLPLLLRAQSNFKIGYYVDKSLDTVKGYIDYREWDKNPNEIRFKKVLADKSSISLSPDYIQSFSVIGLESYISLPTKISLDPVDLSSVGRKDTSFDKRSVFLKVLITGPKYNLLQFTDNIK
jgi:hypothetical protein